MHERAPAQDNASTEAQLQPLLPGPGPHRVVVTSRHTLAGLGARLLDITVLDEDAGVALLDEALGDARPGDDRIGADRAGAVHLARICAGLPLALQIAAALLTADLSRTVSDLADELDDEVRRLEALRYDDGGGTSAPSVAAAFDGKKLPLFPREPWGKRGSVTMPGVAPVRAAPTRPDLIAVRAVNWAYAIRPVSQGFSPHVSPGGPR
jgi:hypothetical protein